MIVSKSVMKYLKFTEGEGAGTGDNCHIASLSLANQRIVDWLDETMTKNSLFLQI